MLRSKLFHLFAFVCLVGLFLGLNLNLNFKFTDLDSSVTLNIMLIVIGGTIILFSLKNQLTLFKITFGAASATFLIIIADYYTGYAIGLYPITCYWFALTVLMGLCLFIESEVDKVFGLVAGLALLAVSYVPLVRHIFDKMEPYYWYWLVFPVVSLLFICMLMAKIIIIQTDGRQHLNSDNFYLTSD